MTQVPESAFIQLNVLLKYVTKENNKRINKITGWVFELLSQGVDYTPPPSPLCSKHPYSVGNRARIAQPIILATKN